MELADPTLLPQTTQSVRVPRAILLGSAVFCLLSIWMACASEGFLEADASTHYLLARHGLDRIHLLVSVWNRPLFMGLYTLPAAFGGIVGARLMSLALALLCAWTAWRIARKLDLSRPELAFLAVLAQPLLFLHSFAEMTELPFAATIGLAFLAFLHRRWGWMSLLVAISPTCRPEGFGFILLAALALVIYRKWLWLLVLPSGLLAWTLAGWILWGNPDYGHGLLDFLFWLPKQWPYSASSMYEAGPLLFMKHQHNGLWATSFLFKLPTLVGPLMFPFLLVGTWLALQNWRQKLTTDTGRGLLLVALLPWAILAGHSFLWWRGMMASNGELRYLLVTAPMWGILAALGFAAWNPSLRLAGRLMPQPLLIGVLALLPAIGNFWFSALPLRPYTDDLLGKEVAAWYTSEPGIAQNYPRVIASHPSIYLYLDIRPGDPKRSLMGDKANVKKNPPGTVLIWDAQNSTHNADANLCITREEVLAGGWQMVQTFTRDSKTWELYLSRNPR